MKIAKRIGGIVLILSGLLFIGVFVYVKSTLPDYSGAHQVPGLTGRIEIIRDQFAVPHIYADHQDDLAFGMGYAMAEDRLWQMDLFRRVATGRLSEIFGKRTLDADRFAKVLGFERESGDLFDAMQIDEKNYLMSFVKGINHYIVSHPDNIPTEFRVLQYQPENFTARDIIALSHFQSYASNHNWKFELLRASAIRELGEKKGRQLVPALTFNGPYMAQPGKHEQQEGKAGIRDFSYHLGKSSESKSTPVQGDDLLHTAMLDADTLIQSLTGIQTNQVHSNFWIVAGEKSQSGKPLFANDYHMPFLLPSLWYELHLVGDGIDAMGITMPGYPTIIAGHNRHIAWGATTTGADTQDLYWEKLNVKNPGEYLYQGEYYPFGTHDENIHYLENGELKTEKTTVLASRHGPIINSITDKLPDNETPLAFRGITNAAQGQIAFSMKIYRAQNWTEFKHAIAQMRSPVWNWGYADKQGNIGFKLSGKIPLRAKGQGLEPHNGWDGEFEWLGFIPLDELPEVYNPEAGYIVSANNEIHDDKYPHMIFGSAFQLPYRAMRIESLINTHKQEKLTQQDFRSIQADTHSGFGLALNTHINQALAESNTSGRKILAMQQYLAPWDGSTDIDSVANTIVQEFFVQLLHRTFANKISQPLFDQLVKSGNLNYAAGVLLLILEDPALENWLDDPLTPGTENAQQTILASLKAAHDSLSRYFGNDMAEWHWGEIHSSHFKHALGKTAPLKWFWNLGANKQAGDISSVDPGTYIDIKHKPYLAEHGASMRHIIDFGHWQNADLVITTGQSGRWLSPHYADQTALWQQHEYVKIPTEKDNIRNQATGITTFNF